MRGMFKMYDELESTNDTACLRYMLNNNSNNNTICGAGVSVKYTCVCKECKVMSALVSKFSHEPCWVHT